MEHMTVFLVMLLGSVPVLLAVLIGSVVAMVLWRRAPGSALLVLIACAGQFVVTLFGVWLSGWWMPAVRDEGVPMAHVSQIMGLWGMCASVLHGVLIGLLIWAAFAGRARTQAAPPPMA